MQFLHLAIPIWLDYLSPAALVIISKTDALQRVNKVERYDQKVDLDKLKPTTSVCSVPRHSHRSITHCKAWSTFNRLPTHAKFVGMLAPTMKTLAVSKTLSESEACNQPTVHVQHTLEYRTCTFSARKPDPLAAGTIQEHPIRATRVTLCLM